MAFKRDQFIRDALDSGSFTFDEINAELTKRGQPTISPQMEAPLRIAQSKLFPWLAAAATGLASTPAGLTGPGAGAGYLGASTIQKSIRDKAAGPRQSLEGAGDEALGQLGNASVATTLGWLGQGLAGVMGGLGKFYDTLRSPSQLKKLGEKRAAVLAKQEPMPFSSVESDLLESIPKNKRITGAGYSTDALMSQIQKYLESVKPLTKDVPQTGYPKDILATKRMIGYPEIQQLVSQANKQFTPETTGLRKDVTQSAADVLRDLYIKQITPDLNERMAYFQKLLPGRENLIRNTGRAAIGTGTAIGLGSLLNALRSSE